MYADHLKRYLLSELDTLPDSISGQLGWPNTDVGSPNIDLRILGRIQRYSRSLPAVSQDTEACFILPTEHEAKEHIGASRLLFRDLDSPAASGSHTTPQASRPWSASAHRPRMPRPDSQRCDALRPERKLFAHIQDTALAP